MTSAPPRRAPLPDIWWRQSLRTRRVIAVALLLSVTTMVVAWTAWPGDDVAPAEAEEYVAGLPVSSLLRWEMLAECESGRQWDLATGNGFFGGLQFTQQSWNGVGGVGSPAEATREEQIMRAGFLFDLQGWDAWPSCTRQLGFTNPPAAAPAG